MIFQNFLNNIKMKFNIGKNIKTKIKGDGNNITNIINKNEYETKSIEKLGKLKSKIQKKQNILNQCKICKKNKNASIKPVKDLINKLNELGGNINIYENNEYRVININEPIKVHNEIIKGLVFETCKKHKKVQKNLSLMHSEYECIEKNLNN